MVYDWRLDRRRHILYLNLAVCSYNMGTSFWTYVRLDTGIDWRNSFGFSLAAGCHCSNLHNYGKQSLI